jgi:hypothetical protein
MSTAALSTGPSNPADERRPLLESCIGSAYIDVQPDLETAISADEPEEAEIVAKKVDYWRMIWYLVFATFGGVLLGGMIKDLIENGDVEVRVVTVLAICNLVAYPSLA